MGRQVAIASGGACLNLCGRVFLRIAMALIERYQLVVTNGSGLMLTLKAATPPCKNVWPLAWPREWT